MPVRGGVVLSLERLNRILEIDEGNLLAVVEPNVITGDLQDAVERVGLFYPPDPASLRQSVIGGNVAECAGGPRAFKYGVTKQYVLGLEAVLPTGEIIRTGGKVVKNVVGYDLTHLLVGSEGTLAILTKIILRLIPKPPRAGDAARDVSERRARRRRRHAPDARARRAGGARADRRRLPRGRRRVSEGALAGAGRHGRAAADRGGRPGRAGGGGSRARRAGVPRGGRDRGAARARRSRAPGALARAARDLAVAQDDHAAQVQPRRRRAEGARAGAVRAGRRPQAAISGCGFRASATSATATSTSTSW